MRHTTHTLTQIYHDETLRGWARETRRPLIITPAVVSTTVDLVVSEVIARDLESNTAIATKKQRTVRGKDERTKNNTIKPTHFS